MKMPPRCQLRCLLEPLLHGKPPACTSVPITEGHTVCLGNLKFFSSKKGSIKSVYHFNLSC